MKILFLCMANSARSQMAEGIARSLFKDSVEVYSAGAMGSYVHPYAIEAMRRIDIDISSQHSQSVETIPPDAVDTVVTLCEQRVCPPFLLQAKQYHWPMPNPTQAKSEEDQIAAFCEIRDEIAIKLKKTFPEFLR